jgi:hypothetical protein
MDKPITQFDKRIVHRSVRKGLITSEELDLYHADLPDSSEKGEIVTPADLEEEPRAARRGADAPPGEEAGEQAAATEDAGEGEPAPQEASGREEAAPSGTEQEGDASGEAGADPSGEEGPDPSGEPA